MIAGLAGDGHAERPEVPGEHRGVGRDPPGSRGRAPGAPSPPPTLTSRIGQPRAIEPAGHPDRLLERRLERGKPVREPAGPGVEVDRVHRQAVARGRVHRLVEPVLVDPELRGAVARVLEAGVVAGAPGRVHPDPDRAARGAPPDPLDLADGVEVEAETVRGEDDVQVALGDVRAGVADLVGEEAALEGAGHLARRAGVDAHALGRARRAQAPEDGEDLGSGFAFIANRSRYGIPAVSSAAWKRRAFSR